MITIYKAKRFLLATNPFKLVIIILGTLVLLQNTASASTVAISIGGPEDGFDPLGPSSLNVAADDGAAATFQINSDLINSSFDFGLYCFTLSGCSGLAYLTSSPLGPNGSIAGLISVTSVAGSFGDTTINTAFSGVDLSVGTYSVVLQMEEGLSSWVGSQSPTFSGDGRATHLDSLLIPVAEGNYFPTSSFINANSTFQYELTAVSAVPLPASTLLMASGLFILISFIRRK